MNWYLQLPGRWCIWLNRPEPCAECGVLARFMRQRNGTFYCREHRHPPQRNTTYFAREKE